MKCQRTSGSPWKLFTKPLIQTEVTVVTSISCCGSVPVEDVDARLEVLDRRPVRQGELLRPVKDGATVVLLGGALLVDGAVAEGGQVGTEVGLEVVALHLLE